MSILTNFPKQSSEIMSEETSNRIWDRCHREIVKGDTKHLLVMSSVPVTYPRLVSKKKGQETKEYQPCETSI